MSNSNETIQLLERVSAREPQALVDLFGRHRERLRRMVRLRLDRRLRSRFDSTAVLQDVYLEVSRRMDEYLANPSRPFFVWLRQLTGEKIQALHRQYLGGWDGGQEVSLYRGALPEANSVSLAAQLLGHMANVPQAAARADMQIRLQDALNSMDPVDREILALCHFEELSNGEAAVVLGLDRTTASQTYLRAVKRLKEILNSIPGFFDPKRR